MCAVEETKSRRHYYCPSEFYTAGFPLVFVIGSPNKCVLRCSLHKLEIIQELKFRIKYNEYLTRAYDIIAGVSQRSVLKKESVRQCFLII